MRGLKILYAHLNRISHANGLKNNKTTNVLDLGTGIGNLIPVLAENFTTVVAVDYSGEMLKIARKKYSKLRNVRFFKKDIRNLEDFHGKFDVTVAVNSILIPSLKDIFKSLDETYNTLKPGGIFLGIFPSMNSMLYYAFLNYEEQLSRYKDSAARKNTCKIIEAEKYDFLFGEWDFDGRQKAYYDFELNYLLKRAGFRNIRLKKVNYSWKESAASGFGNFRGKPELWDWFISAEKPEKS